MKNWDEVLGSASIALAFLCCVIPGELENILLIGMAGVGIVMHVWTKIFNAKVDRDFRKGAYREWWPRWLLGYGIFFLGYYLSLEYGIYGKSFGFFKMISNDLPFLSRLALLPILTSSWLTLKERHYRELFLFSTGVLFIFGVWGVGQFLNTQFNWDLSFLNYVGDPDSGPSRIYHERPIALVWQTAPCLLAGLFIYRQNRTEIAKFIYPGFFQITLLLLFCAGLGTGNRIFAGLMLGVLLLDFRFVLSKTSWSALRHFAVLTFLGVMVLFSPGMSRIQHNTFEANESFGRKTIWLAQTRAFLDHPIFGVGRRTNRFSIYRDYLPEQPLSGKKTAWNAHNLVLDLLASMGVLGALGFFLIFIPFPEKIAGHLLRWIQSRSLRAPQWMNLWAPFALIWCIYSMFQSPLETPNVLMEAILSVSFLNSKLMSRNQKKVDNAALHS